jgi:hypothetical protein
MKGFIDDANYSVGVLDEGTNLENVIDNYVYEHTLVSKLGVYNFPNLKTYQYVVFVLFCFLVELEFELILLWLIFGAGGVL